MYWINSVLFSNFFCILSDRGHSINSLPCVDDQTEEGNLFFLRHVKVKGDYFCSE